MNNYRNTLLDPEWVVAINEEIAANPMGIAFAIEPDLMGHYDAAQGNVCQPLVRGYRSLGDIAAYEDAYNATAATWAATVQGVNDALHAEDTAEYEDWQMDIEWMRGGC